MAKLKYQPPNPPAGGFSTKLKSLRVLIYIAIPMALFAAYAILPISWVIHQHNGEFLIASYRFLEDDFQNPRLRLLRKREHLDQVVAPGKTEFEKLVLLRHWAHGQWKSQKSFYYPPWDAVEILDLARKYGNRGFCAQYAMVFLQACQSLGFHARYVELDQHFIVGVWSNDYNMWVVMDPTNDLYYERDSHPLAGTEICKAYWANDVQEINSVSYDGQRKPLSRSDIAAFKLYSIVRTADQLSHPVGVRINGSPLQPLTRESDFRRYPLIGRDRLAIGSMYLVWKPDGHPEFNSDKPMTTDRDEFRYKENQTMLFVARNTDAQGVAKVIMLPENSPTFEKFLCSINGADWQPTNAQDVIWTLSPGMNKLSARIVTKFGWQGPVSSLSIYYKPANHLLPLS